MTALGTPMLRTPPLAVVQPPPQPSQPPCWAATPAGYQLQSTVTELWQRTHSRRKTRLATAGGQWIRTSVEVPRHRKPSVRVRCEVQSPKVLLVVALTGRMCCGGAPTWYGANIADVTQPLVSARA